MAKARTQDQEDEEGDENGRNRKRSPKYEELGLACMLNTEVGAVLAALRRNPDPTTSQFLTPQEENTDPSLLNSLRSLRALIFNPKQEWQNIDPTFYISPFLEVIESDSIPATATSIALSAILKILKLEIFNEKTPGAGNAIQMVVNGITNCHLETSDSISEDAIMMRVLQVLPSIIRHPASILLTNHAVCTIVNTCFQVVQQSAKRGDLLQKNARHMMHEIIQAIFARLPLVESSELDVETSPSSTYGVRCMEDIFNFLCSMLSVVGMVDADGVQNADDDVQLFVLILINSAIELGGERIGKHPKLMWMIQDDLFRHLIQYGLYCTPLVLSMICSTVLNLYHFLRRSLRLQLEAFFTYVLIRVATGGSSVQLQEVAVEGIISFCRQPTFIMEAYVNFDCDPIRKNVFEDIGKVFCKFAFPASGPLSSIQIQAFEGLVDVIHNIADSMDNDKKSPPESYSLEIPEYQPFWVERCDNYNDLETWVRFVRVRKFQKKKIMIAANHFNRDEKKGLEFLKLSGLVTEPPDPESYAYFFRYTPGLDKNKIGDFLGDPDEFNLRVLKIFSETFEFSGVILDTALRTFLETFRLPGESQKIQRILEAFSERYYYVEQSSGLFVTKDAVYILCYSLIMLNTDQHNPQVKKKMTEGEFIKNNRAINGGKDLPREYLSELFQSIANNAITVFGQSAASLEMSSSRWIDLLKRSKIVEPYILCNFEHHLSRELFASISGPLVAAVCAIFEHTDEEDILHECIGAMISVARIARFGLHDILDELLSSLCKSTTLLNPYASTEETLFAFSNDLKPRMATLAVFTIASKFGEEVRGAWRNVVDCVLKLRRLKLLPQSAVEPDTSSTTTLDLSKQSKSESGVILPSSYTRKASGVMGRFSHFLTLDSGDDFLASGGSDFEQNLKTIQQCRIGNIFSESSNLPEESLLNLGRALIFAASGKGQKFSTPIEEDETVGFCWEALVAITSANLHRFLTLWPSFHEYMLAVAQLPVFSPCPFAEKAIIGLFKICLKLLSSSEADKLAEELIFKSINLAWKLEKEILDTCCESITQSISKIISEYSESLETPLGWKTILHLLSVTARYPETFEQGVEALILFMSNGTQITKSNYAACIDCAFGFAALKIGPLETCMKLIDLMADSVTMLVQWHRSDNLEPDSNISNFSSSTSGSSTEDGMKPNNSLVVNLFVKLADTLRKMSLVRREEIRNHAVVALKRSFSLVDELDFTPTSCINCFNLVIFAMVDDLHEKMVEYSRRGNAERETKSMEGTLEMAMVLLVEVFLQFLKLLSQNPSFQTFWLGVLRRMDTCMKADLGDLYESKLPELVPELLKRMIAEMTEKEILVERDGDELWEITNIQIQWIAPSVKEELIPEDDF